MATQNSFIQTVDQIVTSGVSNDILHLVGGVDGIQGTTFDLNGKNVINFGSCSYLGLEFDQRLQNASIKAIQKYGTQFAESRAYVSIYEYELLEQKLNRIFNGHTIVTPTTTLGHIACIPVVVGKNDIVLMDHQVHSSVQTACSLLKAQGIQVELTRHNALDALEDKIKHYRTKYDQVWYMADGVYSMFGDFAPVKELYALLEQYPNFRLYIDDAHGMSVFGKNGSGYVLSQIRLHQRMILATSLAKGFATGGGVLVFPDAETRRLVRTCGGPLITSGPVQPAVLGAANACADIHLSGEIYSLQEELQENIKYTNLIASKLKLPLIKTNETAVFFVGVSLPKVGYNLIKRLYNAGYYTNLGVYPAVPLRNTGVRFTITRLHTFSQIESMLVCMAENLPQALSDEDFSMDQVYKAFKITPEAESLPSQLNHVSAPIDVADTSILRLETFDSISEVDQTLWNSLLGYQSTFTYSGMQQLEQVFQNQRLPENNWVFKYIVIRSGNGTPLLATFVTVALTKDDMLSPSFVSKYLEEKRKENGCYYLCSKTLIVGSMITEGNHLYVNREDAEWQKAFTLLVEKLAVWQDAYQTNAVVIRDLPESDSEMDALMLKNGFVKQQMPENHTVLLGGNVLNVEAYINQVPSSKSRQYLRKETLPFVSLSNVSYTKSDSVTHLTHLYELYKNVQQKSRAINTFELPFQFFDSMQNDPNWEVLTLFDASNPTLPLAAVWCYKNGAKYIPLLVGIDYQYLESHGIYRQCIWRAIERAGQLQCKEVQLGFGATIEKRKFGAQISNPVAYVQIKDAYQLQELSHLEVLAKSQAF